MADVAGWVWFRSSTKDLLEHVEAAGTESWMIDPIRYYSTVRITYLLSYINSTFFVSTAYRISVSIDKSTVHRVVRTLHAKLSRRTSTRAFIVPIFKEQEIRSGRRPRKWPSMILTVTVR